MTLKSLQWSKDLTDAAYYEASSIIRAHLSECEEVCSLMGDEESRLAYNRELTYQITRRIISDSYQVCARTQGISIEQYTENLQKIPNNEKYKKFPLSEQRERWVLNEAFVSIYLYEQYRYRHVSPEAGDIIYDCGGCFGESALWFSKFQPRHIYSFEIDPSNQKILKHMIEQEKMPCSMVPKALGKQSGTIWYRQDPNNAGGGIVSEEKIENASPVEMISIDDFSRENSIAPSFIKMDLEGAEYDVLLGAKSCIQECRPKLAISLYHKIEDMWRIPLLRR